VRYPFPKCGTRVSDCASIVRSNQVFCVDDGMEDHRANGGEGGASVECASTRRSSLLPLTTSSPPLFFGVCDCDGLPDSAPFFASPFVSLASGTVSRSHTSSSSEGRRGTDIARLKMDCGEWRWGDFASEGGTGTFTGLLDRRRDFGREASGIGCL